MSANDWWSIKLQRVYNFSGDKLKFRLVLWLGWRDFRLGGAWFEDRMCRNVNRSK